MELFKWTISFIAEKEKDRHDRKVVMRVNWDGNLVRKLIGYRVDCTPTNSKEIAEKDWECRWDWNKQRCKPNTTHGQHKAAAINKQIDEMEKKATSILEKYTIIEKRPPTEKEFREEFEGKRRNGKITFYSALDEFVKTGGTGKGWSQSVYNKFGALKDHLMKYNPKLTLNFNIDDANGLLQWYITNGYRNTTTTKNAALLKWFLRWAYGKGYYNGKVHTSAWKVKLSGVGTSEEILFLEWEEVMQLWNFEPYDYKPEDDKDPLPAIGAATLKQVKDCFLFQCFTGLRYSDLKKVRRTDIKDGVINIVTQKTGDRLKIELNEFSRAILERYKHIPFKNDLALPVISNQKMNEYLKVLLKEAEINAPYSDVYYIGGERHEEIKKKWEIIGTHTGRRTFVVTSLSLGIDPLVVMKWTGHSDFKAMQPYIAIVDKKKKEGAGMFDKLFKTV